MNTKITSLLLPLALAASSAFANEPEHKMSTQQSRMANCAHESKGMKSEERRHFMSECLKGHAASGAAHAKEITARTEASATADRAKACGAEAARKELHGDERQAFVTGCLKD